MFSMSRCDQEARYQTRLGLRRYPQGVPLVGIAFGASMRILGATPAPKSGGAFMPRCMAPGLPISFDIHSDVAAKCFSGRATELPPY